MVLKAEAQVSERCQLGRELDGVNHQVPRCGVADTLVADEVQPICRNRVHTRRVVRTSGDLATRGNEEQ